MLGTASSGQQQQASFQFEQLRWVVRPLYEGSSVASEFIEGVLVNNSAITLSSPIVFASLYSPDGSVLGDTIPSTVQTIPPGGRWAFSLMLGLPTSGPVSYAKITRAFCFVTGQDGRPARLDFTPSNTEPIWSPQELAMRAAIEESVARQRVKLEGSERKAFQKGTPCPSSGKTNGRCQGYDIGYIVSLASGGQIAASNMRWIKRP
jgi:hypothetical protein